MKFELLYFVAKLRGMLLKEDWKFNVRLGTIDKQRIKELYMINGWIPHRIEKTGTGFIK